MPNKNNVDEYGNYLGIKFLGAIQSNGTGNFDKVHLQCFSHSPDGTTSNGNEYRCIHSDSWNDICYWNDVDPSVYSQCMAKRCTKTVYLDTERVQGIFNQDSDLMYQYIEGDGVAVIHEPLLRKNIRWNYVKSVEGGYKSSRLRALLNGSTEDTLSDNDAEYLSEDNCIFACLPSVLRENIANSKQVYNHDYVDYYCYDKLITPSLSMTSGVSYINGVWNTGLTYLFPNSSLSEYQGPLAQRSNKVSELVTQVGDNGANSFGISFGFVLK